MLESQPSDEVSYRSSPATGLTVLTVEDGTGGGSYAVGTLVIVNANAPPEGSQFADWAGDTSILSNPSAPIPNATIPRLDVMAKATYSGSGLDISLNRFPPKAKAPQGPTRKPRQSSTTEVFCVFSSSTAKEPKMQDANRATNKAKEGMSTVIQRRVRQDAMPQRQRNATRCRKLMGRMNLMHWLWMRPDRLSPRNQIIPLTAPVICLVLAATAVPIEVRSLREVELSFNIGDVSDIIANIVGYLPVGIVLGRLGIWKAGLVAGLISAFAETSQLFMLHRDPFPLHF
jgi:hypothetical protein